MEIGSSIEEIGTVLDFYVNILHYGEWGEFGKKPTSFVLIENEKGSLLKDKEYIRVRDILELAKNSKFIKFSIFFEPIIEDGILEELYLKSNSYWIHTLGGLYDVVDLALYIEGGGEQVWGVLSEKIVLPFSFKNYTKEDLEDYAIETTLSARDLVSYSKKWELFTFKPLG